MRRRGPRNYVIAKRMRQAVNKRWLPEEEEVVRSSVAASLTLDETCALLPHRTRDSVKDRFYRAKEPRDRDEPASLNDARRQKDAREGSAALLDALIRAGFVRLEARRVGA